jgi:hypothetical protein
LLEGTILGDWLDLIIFIALTSLLQLDYQSINEFYYEGTVQQSAQRTKI